MNTETVKMVQMLLSDASDSNLTEEIISSILEFINIEVELLVPGKIDGQVLIEEACDFARKEYML